jgi:hypothetical protein
MVEEVVRISARRVDSTSKAVAAARNSVGTRFIRLIQVAKETDHGSESGWTVRLEVRPDRR